MANRLTTRLIPLVATAALWTGCGPVQSTAYLLDADINLQAAKTAGAEKYAPYEWTAATLYLMKAREEVGTSDYEAAVSFAQKASKFANEARDRSLAATRNELPP